jgi:peptidyl-tRNA hydrolase, PTH1 family
LERPVTRLARLFGKFRLSHDREREMWSSNGAEVRWVVVGLGNPGTQYHRSRHNVGFAVIDRIAAARGVEVTRRKFKGLYAETRLGNEPAILLKPQTFYNLSGESVAAVLGYFKVPIEQLIVVHDDLDLVAGQLRIKRGGGDAGNLGVRSIAETLGSPDFIRVRIGIGHPVGEEDSKAYVLKLMNSAELEAFEQVIERAAEAVEAIVAESLERAMNRYNQRL